MRKILLISCCIAGVVLQPLTVFAATPHYYFYTKPTTNATTTVGVGQTVSNNTIKTGISDTQSYVDVGNAWGTVYNRHDLGFEIYTLKVSGTTNNTKVTNGTEEILAGGIANGTILSAEKSTNVQLLTGLENNGNPIYGPNINIYETPSAEQKIGAWGVANGTQIYTGTQTIVSYGTANNTVLHNTNSKQIVSGGTANSTTIHAGTQTVSGGGAAHYTTINGGSQTVTGSTATNTTINNGTQTLTNSTANNTDIVGGTQNITNSTVDSTTVRTNGAQNVNSGTVTNTTVVGGTQKINGGTVTTGSFTGGRQTILGGSVSDYSFLGGTQTISNGTVNNITLSGFATQTITGGTVTNVTAKNGSTQTINNVTVNGTILESGAVQTLNSGAVNNTHLANATQNINSGTANNTYFEQGMQNIYGGTITNTHFEKGTQNLNAGSVSDTYFEDGTQNIHTGTVNNTEFEQGTQNINNGIVNNTKFYNGGTQNLAAGQANDTQINNGLQVVSGGTATNTKVTNGAQNVFAGVANNNELVNSEQIVGGLGVANNNIVRDGVQRVESGGTVNGSKLYNSQQILADSSVIGGVQEISDGILTFDGTNITGGGTIKLNNTTINSNVNNVIVAPSVEGTGNIHIDAGQHLEFASLDGTYNIAYAGINSITAESVELLSFNSGVAEFSILGGNSLDVGASRYELVNTGNAVRIQNSHKQAGYVGMLPEIATALDTQFYRFSNYFTDISFLHEDEDERPFQFWANALYDHFNEKDDLYSSNMYGMTVGGSYFLHFNDSKVFTALGAKYAYVDTDFTAGENIENDILSTSFSVGYVKNDSYLVTLTTGYALAKSENTLISNGRGLPFKLDQQQFSVALEAASLLDLDFVQVRPALIGSFALKPASEFKLNGIDGKVMSEYSAAIRSNFDIRYYNDTTLDDYSYSIYLKGGPGYKTGDTEIKYGGYVNKTDKGGLTYDVQVGFQVSGELITLGASAEYHGLPVGNSVSGNFNFKINF
ncbi:hypothetical protein LJB93_02020 [Desulfovibrio sp. OttesenSCG-928-F07]|nr:hypothetical protein [Desulfovibrio sp. OttesenSCG-928-F07]